MLELTNLRVFHKDMKNRGENQAVFNIQINNKYFSCIFITNVTPYYLYLATVGNTVKTFEFEVGQSEDLYSQIQNEFIGRGGSRKARPSHNL